MHLILLSCAFRVHDGFRYRPSPFYQNTRLSIRRTWPRWAAMQRAVWPGARTSVTGWSVSALAISVYSSRKPGRSAKRVVTAALACATDWPSRNRFCAIVRALYRAGACWRSVGVRLQGERTRPSASRTVERWDATRKSLPELRYRASQFFVPSN